MADSVLNQPARLLRRLDDVLHSTIEADVVALSVARGECFGMEGVTAEIWRALATPHSLDDLCVQLEAAYDVTPDTCRRETALLLDEMIAGGLIAWAE